MKKLALILALALNLSNAFASAESDNLERRTRCGWIDLNRSPYGIDASLSDIDNLWTLSNESFQAKGEFPSVPDDKNQYVSTMNGEYFCGCIYASYDGKEGNVLGIFSTRNVELSQCIDWAKQEDNLKRDYRPIKNTSRNGSAYTECQSDTEFQQTYKGRQICVNEIGEYYYLVEEVQVPRGFQPTNNTSRAGTAYTECLDEKNEIQKTFENRQICVNKAGDYYFLAQ